MPLSFLYPAFLIGALAAAVPIVLHLLRREAAPRVPFSAVRFLKRAPVEQTRRKRLRELLLLALRVAALVLLALAFARPYVTGIGPGGAAPVTIVAVDTSFSLSAPGQFERARERAERAIEAAPAGGLVGVLQFDDRAVLVAEPLADRARARAAVQRLEPGYGATRYRSALAEAASAIGTREGRIIVVTDLQQSGWEGQDRGTVPERLEIAVEDVGMPAVNLAVTSLRRDGGRGLATVFNGGTAPQESRAVLMLDGREIGSADFTVAPGAQAELRFPAALPDTGALSLSIDDPEGLQADNVRHLVLDPAAVAPLLAIAGGGSAATSEEFYLEQALLAAEGGGRLHVTTRTGREASAFDPAYLERHAAVLLLATRGLERRGRELLAEYVRAGGGLLVATGPDTDAQVLRGLFEPEPVLAVEPAAGPAAAPVSLVPADARHPIFRPFGGLMGNLGQVRFRQTMRLEADDRELGHVLVRFSNGAPALLERRVGEGRVLLFASDLSNRWNDFPLHPTFVPFVHELMRYLAAGRDEPQEYLVADVPPGMPRQPGIATIGEPVRRVAINVDPAESRLARVSPQEFDGAVTRLNRAAAALARDEAQAREAGQGLWRYGLMLMLAALVMEGALGTRMGGG